MRVCVCDVQVYLCRCDVCTVDSRHVIRPNIWIYVWYCVMHIYIYLFIYLFIYTHMCVVRLLQEQERERERERGMFVIYHGFLVAGDPLLEHGHAHSGRAASWRLWLSSPFRVPWHHWNSLSLWRWRVWAPKCKTLGEFGIITLGKCLGKSTKVLHSVLCGVFRMECPHWLPLFQEALGYQSWVPDTIALIAPFWALHPCSYQHAPWKHQKSSLKHRNPDRGFCFHVHCFDGFERRHPRARAAR